MPQGLSNWDELASTPTYLGLDIDTRRKVRKLWFEDNLAKTDTYRGLSEADQNAVFAQFDAESEQTEGYRRAQPERGFVADAAASFLRGVGGAAQMAGHGLEMLDLEPGEADESIGVLDKMGRSLTEWGEEWSDKPELLPTQKQQRGEYGFIRKGVMEGIESLPASAAPFVVGGAVGLINPLAGVVAGTGTMLGTFGLGTYGQEYGAVIDELERTRPELSREERQEIAGETAFKTAGFEAGTEGLSNFAALLTFGGSKALTQPITATLKNLTRHSAKELAKRTGQQTVFETGSEMIAGGGQAWARQTAGLEGGTIGEGVAGSIVPALTMSLFFGLGGAAYNRAQSAASLKRLNSDDQQVQYTEANRIAKQITENTNDSVLADLWLKGAKEVIDNNGRFAVDERLVDFAKIKARERLMEQPSPDISTAESGDEAVDAFNESMKPKAKAPELDIGLIAEARKKYGLDRVSGAVGEVDFEQQQREISRRLFGKPPTTAALPPGQGFELVDDTRAEDWQREQAEIEQRTKKLPAGQGFEIIGDQDTIDRLVATRKGEQRVAETEALEQREQILEAAKKTEADLPRAETVTRPAETPIEAKIDEPDIQPDKIEEITPETHDKPQDVTVQEDVKKPTIEQVHQAIVRDAKTVPEMVKSYGGQFQEDYKKYISDTYGKGKIAQSYLASASFAAIEKDVAIKPKDRAAAKPEMPVLKSAPEVRKKFQDTLVASGVTGVDKIQWAPSFGKDRAPAVELAKELGHNVVFFRSRGGSLDNIGGTVHHEIPGTIFLNLSRPNYLKTLVGHEVLHRIKRESPDLYKSLHESLQKDIRNFGEYAQTLAKQRKAAGLKEAGKELAIEEFFADFMGDQLANREFYDRLHKKDPSLAKKIIRAIKDIIDKILGKQVATRIDSEKHFKDLRKAQDVLAEVITKYKAAKTTTDGQGVSMAAASQAKTNAFKKWFGNSKVVDKKGEPLVVYHGTPYGNFAKAAKKVNRARSAVIKKRKELLQNKLDVYSMFDWDSPQVDQRAGRELIRELEQEERKLPPIPAHPRKEGDVFRHVGTNDEGYLGQGFYFTADASVAQKWADFAGRPRVAGETKAPYVYEVYLKMENPFRPDVTEYTPEMAATEQQIYNRLTQYEKNIDRLLSARALAKTQMLKKYGYDGVIGESAGKQGVEYVVFESTQIKSVDNRGTFDPKDPDISFGVVETLKGQLSDITSKAVKYHQPKKTFSLFEKALSVPLHYFGKLEPTSRIYKAAEAMPDNREEMVNHLLQRKNPDGSKDDYGPFLRKMYKKDKREGRRFGKYLVGNDRDGLGYQIFKKGKSFAVRKLTKNPKDPNKPHENVFPWYGEFATEKEAAQRIIDLECEDRKQDGWKKEWVDMLRWTREIGHKMYDEYYEKYRELKKLAEETKNPNLLKVVVQTEDGKVKINLDTAMAEMGDMRGWYYPRIHKQGRVILYATKKGKNPERHSFDLGFVAEKQVMGKDIKAIANMATPLGFKARELAKKGYEVKIKQAAVLPENVFLDFAGQYVAMSHIISHSLSREGEGFLPEFKEILAAEIATNLTKTILARGARQRMIRRREARGPDVWMGYEEDPVIAITKAAAQLSGAKAKYQFAQTAIPAMMGTDVSFEEWKEKQEGDKPSYDDYLEFVKERRIDPAEQKEAYEVARAYIRDILRNDETVDRVLGTIKGLAIVKYLGGSISAPVVNLTNMVAGVPATMAYDIGIPINKTFKFISKATKRYVQYKHGGSKGNKAFDYIESKGWHKAQFNREALKVLKNKFGNSMNRFADIMMVGFDASEQLNRAATIEAAYRALTQKNPDLAFEDAMKQAKKISDRAHGVYGPINYPHAARGGSVAAQIFKSFYTFRTFAHNYVLNMVRMGLTSKESMYMMIAPAVLTGVGASIMTPLLNIVGKAFGMDDPEEELYLWLGHNYGGTYEAIARHGLIGMGGHGVSLKGSLSIGITDLPTSIKDIAGAPYSVLEDVYGGAASLMRGDHLKGVEKLMPAKIAVGPVRAYREATEGVTSKSNVPIFYGQEQLTAGPLDRFLRSMSFSPARMAGIREKQWAERRFSSKMTRWKTDIHAKIKAYKLRRTKSKSRWEDIMTEVDEFNRILSNTRIHITIPAITEISIKRMLKRAGKPPKRERER